jgi:hypothetical protein
MPLQGAICEQPHGGHDDICDQHGVTLDGYRHVAVSQILVFNTLLASNNPASSLCPWVVRSFPWVMVFICGNIA